MEHAIEGQYHGRVVDAESKQPLAGAVVTVIWMKAPFFAMDGVKDFHQAREMLTDADGRFAIDAKPNWAIRSVDREPEIIIYKPGYGRHPDTYRTLGRFSVDAFIATEETLQSLRPATIDLPRLKTREEMLRFVSPLLHPRVDRKRIPILMRLADEYSRSLGLGSLDEPTETPPQEKR